MERCGHQGIGTPIGQGEGPGALNLITGTHATAAANALARIVGDRLVPGRKNGCPDLQGDVGMGELIHPELVCDILKFTRGVAVTCGAGHPVFGDDEFQSRFPQSPDLGC